MDNVRLEVKIRSVPKDPRNLILLACPEPSLASVVATEYLIDSLKMNEIGAIRIRGVEPAVTVIDGVAKLPYRLFYSQETGLIVVRQHIPIPIPIYREFIDKVISWAEENGVSRAVCLSTMSSLGPSESDNVYFVTDELTVNSLTSLGFTPLKETIVVGVEAEFIDAVLSRGTMSGVLLLAESKLLTSINNLVKSGRLSSYRDVTYILNQTIGKFGPDVSAAIKLIKAVSKLINVDIKTDKLEEHASKYSFLVEKSIEEWARGIAAEEGKGTTPLVL
ncbi:MAG: PAC2 family protein [Caldivirga sp.]|jgi:Archaeal enzymes of ATP-grasp superfamily|uniref:proteasome assembly chaperone family protein n=1 Tax=Caldivirga sp. MU80 TaxID=1650354 RepID=UPI000B110038|nr:PAC2 family protein [Caldivirga sp. MU80]